MTQEIAAPPESSAAGLGAPLRITAFRRIWFAGFFANTGTLIQGVGVAWAMTEMASSADMVALVQTALALPTVLVAVLAGAIADVHDRRRVALWSLAIALGGASLLASFTWLDLLTPHVLLALCFAAGCGGAFMAPAWQTVVGEQVPAPALPAAVALNGISYNIARSAGPAIGGLIVATGGTAAAFTLNALSYVPLMAALFLWERQIPRSRLPREELGRAIVTGVRYILNSPPVKVVLIRSAVTGAIGGSIIALMPLVARDLLRGSASVYGVLLSAFGVGAVIGAITSTKVRELVGSETAIRACAVSMGCGIALMAVSRDTLLTSVALLIAGCGWTMGWTLFNIGVQMSVPNWVAGRSLAAYQAASMGGIALGSWGWGQLTDAVGVQAALLASAAMMMGSPIIGFKLRMPPIEPRYKEAEDLEEPEVKLPITGQTGPLVIEVEYRVAQENARTFLKAMQELQTSRQRNGAYGWSIARDLAKPEMWTERFQCPTWHEYLRLRSRSTQADRLLQQEANDLHLGPGKVRVRRMLERPSE